jgi:hypothetical protein
VEEYLKEKTTLSWDEMMVMKPDWVLKRVRRYVPAPEVLYPLVDDLFKSYGPILCTKTGLPLFDKKAEKQSKLVLKLIEEGYVSDPSFVSFYYFLRYDPNGLPVYRCTRGTNAVEGGVHYNIIRKIMSYSAGPFPYGLCSY